MTRLEAMESVYSMFETYTECNIELEKKFGKLESNLGHASYIKGVALGMATAYSKADIITIDDYHKILEEVKVMLKGLGWDE